MTARRAEGYALSSAMADVGLRHLGGGSMDARGLLRCWFEFDLWDHEREVQPGHIVLDGGTDAYRLLGRGAGVTGYDEGDCLALLCRALGEDLPLVVSTVRDVVIDDVLAREIANPAWRGIWFPALNLSGPTIG